MEGGSLDNELIYQGERFEFAKDIIKKRGFIRARYANWQEPRNGLIAFACKDFLNVLFLTGINQCATYFKIKAKEVQAGLWNIIYTNDLENFYRVEGGEPEEDIELDAAVRKLFEEANQNGDNEDGTSSGNGSIQGGNG